MAIQDYFSSVQQFYIAYFGRAADPQALLNFSTFMDEANLANNITALDQAYETDIRVRQLIDTFGTSQESANLYSSASIQDFVRSIYFNLFNRDAKPEGLEFWVNSIESGAVSVSKAALAIAAGAFNNTSEQGQLDAQAVLRKTQVAEIFTNELNTEQEQQAYRGSVAAEQVRELLATVGGNSDPQSFTDQVELLVDQLVQQGTASFIVDSTVGLSSISRFSLDGSPDNSFAITADTTPTIEFQANSTGLSFQVDWGNGVVTSGTTTGSLQRVTTSQAYTGIESHEITITVFGSNNQQDTAVLDLSVAQSTGSVYVDGLIVGTKIENALVNGATPVYYYFDNANSRQAFDEPTKAAFVRAMQSYSEVANLVFIEVTNPESADFKFVLAGNEFFGDPRIGGQMFFPDSEKFDPNFAGRSGEATFNIDIEGWGDFTAGSLAFALIVHELGHGLGLAHPHDDGGVSTVFPENRPGFLAGSPFVRDNTSLALNFQDNDNPVNTTMTYDYSPEEGTPFSAFSGNSSGPGTLDVAALEALYGAKQANTGDNTYTITDTISQADRAEVRAIHDTGGTDTLVYNGTSSSFLSLIFADLIDTSPFVGGLESYSFTANGTFGDVVAFSHRTVIENVVGGSGSDTIIGNQFNNNISGRGGNDFIVATDGNDTIDGGTGFDLLSFYFFESAVSVNLSEGQAFAVPGTSMLISNIEAIEGSFQSDTLIGSFANEVFFSSAGSDLIQGGGGQDAFSAEFDIEGGVLRFTGQGVFYEKQNSGGGAFSSLREIDNYFLTSFSDFVFLSAGQEFQLAASSGFVDAGGSIDFLAIGQAGQSLDMSVLNFSMYGIDAAIMATQGASALQLKAIDLATQVTEFGQWSFEIFGTQSFNKEFLIFGDADDTLTIDSREWSFNDTVAYNGDFFDIISANVNGEVVVLGIDTDINAQFSA